MKKLIQKGKHSSSSSDDSERYGLTASEIEEWNELDNDNNANNDNNDDVKKNEF